MSFAFSDPWFCGSVKLFLEKDKASTRITTMTNLALFRRTTTLDHSSIDF